jgi:hypothetical protein
MNAKDIYMYILGALIVISILGIVGLLVFQPIPEINKDMLNIVLGALLAQFASVVQYFYGSSKGSSDKNEMLNNNKNQ